MNMLRFTKPCLDREILNPLTISHADMSDTTGKCPNERDTRYKEPRFLHRPGWDCLLSCN